LVAKIPEAQKAVLRLKALILRRSRQPKEYVDVEACEQVILPANEKSLAASA
jgi:hypothetical protein